MWKFINKRVSIKLNNIYNYKSAPEILEIS